MTETEGDTTRAAGRPRVICHMVASVDGRIVTDDWPLSAEGQRQYELLHATYAPDAWLCGRGTMERHFAVGVRPEAEVAREHAGAGGMLRAGLVDEVSVLVAPMADGRIGRPALFDIDGGDPSRSLPSSAAKGSGHAKYTPRRLALEGEERRAGDVLWLRYRVESR